MYTALCTLLGPVRPCLPALGRRIRAHVPGGRVARLAALLLALLLPVPALAADVDGDGYGTSDGDCDDTAPDIHPGATETANGVDDDCDYKVDEGTSVYDDDTDGWSEDDGDCDDTNPLTYPDANEWADGADNDCDGTVDEGTDVYDDDGDAFTEEGGDCDDADAGVYPGAVETADGVDEDCDGIVDDTTVVYDDDGDGWTENGGDCDDANVWTWPGASEFADALDNDCDGIVDEGTDVYDDDGDGFAESDGDCDDRTATTFPGAEETANGADDDCDGTVDEGTDWYDDDGDGRAEIDADCDDADAWTYPGAAERLDEVDNDCDGIVDEGTAAYDDDADGFSEQDGDCNDWQPTIFPGAEEEANLADDDCDGTVDEGTEWYDDDGDGFTEADGDCNDADRETWPDAPELNDGLDNDCDGEPESYLGWSCSVTPRGGALWLLPILVAVLCIPTRRGRPPVRRERDHRVVKKFILYPVLLLASSAARGGIVTEVPKGEDRVRILVCDDLTRCGEDAEWIGDREGPHARPLLPAELLFDPRTMDGAGEPDRADELQALLDKAERQVRGERASAAWATLNEAEALLRAWRGTARNADLFRLHYLRGAVRVQGGSGHEQHLRQAAAVADVAREMPAIPELSAEVADLFYDEVRKLKATGRGRLLLHEPGVGVVYEVDGVPVGAGARTVELLPGMHRVTARHPLSVRTFQADVPVLPSRDVSVMATFRASDELPWVRSQLDEAFERLTASDAFVDVLAAWTLHHGIERLELLRVDVDVEEEPLPEVRIGGEDGDRPRAARGAVLEQEDGVPATYEEEILARHEARLSEARVREVRRLRVVWFDPHTRRFSTDAGVPLVRWKEPEPRLRLGLEGGMVRMLGRPHGAVDLAIGWRVAGPVSVEGRVGAVRTNESYNLYTAWVDRSLYHVALGAGISGDRKLTPYGSLLAELYAPVALGVRAEAGLRGAVRDGWSVQGGPWGAIHTVGPAWGVSVGLGRTY